MNNDSKIEGRVDLWVLEDDNDTNSECTESLSPDSPPEDNTLCITADPTDEKSPITSLIKMGYELKAHLILVGVSKGNYGIVEDTHNNLLWKPESGEVVGTWSYTKHDGNIHVCLCETTAALHDRAIQTFKKFAEDIAAGIVPEKKQKKKSSTGTTRAKKPKAAECAESNEEVKSETQVRAEETLSAISDMRRRLLGK